MANALVRVAVALGSNLGDRRGHLEFGIAELARVVSDLRVSAIRETDPVGVAEAQPPYLNAVVVGVTALAAGELLNHLLNIERARGRQRPGLRAPRTLDLDLILHGDQIVQSPALQVPHPRFRERAFVLEPLAELAAEWKDPVTGKTIRLLREELGRRTDESPAGPNGERVSDP